MDDDAKRENAIRFITSLQDMAPGELERLIRTEAGEGLSAFFASYAGGVIQNQAAAPEQAASTLMMLGYLIRADEETGAATEPPPT